MTEEGEGRRGLLRASLGMTYGWTGMGPRMREDNGWGWIRACVFMGVGSVRGVRGWVPACARTRVGMDSSLRLCGGGTCAGGTGTGMGPRMREDNGWGWILACVFMGVGSLWGGTGMGPRMREDNGRGWILACVFMGVGSCGGVRGWVPACARTTGGGWIRLRLHGGGTLRGGVRGWVPACARTTGGMEMRERDTMRFFSDRY